MFANIRHDLKAHGGDWGAQGFWVWAAYRFGRWGYRARPALLRTFFSALYKMLCKCIQIITGIELPCEVEIGRNLVVTDVPDHCIAAGVPAILPINMLKTMRWTTSRAFCAKTARPVQALYLMRAAEGAP